MINCDSWFVGYTKSYQLLSQNFWNSHTLSWKPIWRQCRRWVWWGFIVATFNRVGLTPMRSWITVLGVVGILAETIRVTHMSLVYSHHSFELSRINIPLTLVSYLRWNYKSRIRKETWLEVSGSIWTPPNHCLCHWLVVTMSVKIVGVFYH